MRIGEIYRKWACLSHHFCIEMLREECKQTIQSCQCFSVGFEIFDVYGCILLFSDAFQASADENDYDVFSFLWLKMSKKPIAGDRKACLLLISRHSLSKAVSALATCLASLPVLVSHHWCHSLSLIASLA